MSRVDMGYALALWKFCLALDAIIRYANRIPDIIATKAYMDETNSAGRGREWLAKRQSMWEAMDTAGLQVAKHTCIEIKVENSCTKKHPLQD